MRHNKLNKRFGRTLSERKELMRSMARNTIIHLKIKTTLPKAKETKKMVDGLISLGKAGTIHSMREAFAILQDRSLVSRLFKEIAPLFKDRKGGYTRVIHLGRRHGDGAEMAILELVEKIKVQPKHEKKKKVSETQEKPKPKEEKVKEAKEPKEEKVKKEEKPKEKTPKAAIEAPVKPKQEEKPKKEAPKEKEKKHEPKQEGLFGKLKGFFKKKND
ncbi:MAG: 50S ribosomal protein L17 [Candidatus Omnitrophica bacterium]|nr:50S ribosomal protein L17 [Candidatus Omnitrophota bacterium]